MTVSQTGRRLATVGVAALVASLIPFAPANAQLTADNTQYIVADNNTDTSIKHSRLTYTPLTGVPDNATSEVLIGRADLFADNLAAGTLSGGLDTGRPLFLNDSDSDVSQDILDEIDRVTQGAAEVTAHILGGVAAQGEGVADALEAAGYTVNRFEGETRIETAVDIAQANDTDTVFVVRGFADDAANDPTQAFADSMTAGAVAATLGADILFTQTDVLTGNTAAELEAAGYETAYVVGGTAAISDEVLAAVDELVGTATRVDGATRFDTQIALNDLRPQPVGPSAILVDGQEDDAWANATAAANWSGLLNLPVLLTNQGELPAQTENYLVENHEDADGFAAHAAANFAFCGTNVTPELCQEVADLRGGTSTEFDAPAPPPAETQVTITPAESATQADGTGRAYTAVFTNDDGSLYTGQVIIRLLDANADGTANGSTAATGVTIEQSAATTFTTFAGPDGTVEFVVRDAAGAGPSDAIPQGIIDADGNGVIGTTEVTGLGGAVFFTFVPAEAMTATYTADEVCSVDKATNTIIFDTTDGVCGNGGDVLRSLVYDDNDLYTGAASTQAAFEAALSRGDIITVIYDSVDANQSTFSLVTDNVSDLTVDAPAGPVNVDADTYSIQGFANPGWDVTVYRDQNGNDTYETGVDVAVTTVVAGENGPYSASVALTQNAANNFIVVQRAAGSSTTSAPANVARDVQDVPTITESAAAGFTLLYAAADDNGVANTIDAGDVIALQFSEGVANIVNGDSLTLTDADGTVATLTVGTNVTATRNTANTYQLTVNGFPAITTVGGTAGLQYPVQITEQSGIEDSTDSTALTFPGTSDRIIEVDATDAAIVAAAPMTGATSTTFTASQPLEAASLVAADFTTSGASNVTAVSLDATGTIITVTTDVGFAAAETVTFTMLTGEDLVNNVLPDADVTSVGAA